MPNKLKVWQKPDELTHEHYELRVTTQFTTGKPLKSPRSVSLQYTVEIE